jgi:hypothetical protein
MEITDKDVNDTRIVQKLIAKVENGDLLEVSEISDRIVKNQPFIMSLLIGYKFDLEEEVEEALGEVMQMLFVIYLFFEESTKINKKQVSAREFEKAQNRNMKFLKYFSGEQSDKDRLEANRQFLASLRCKSLLAGILAMSNTQVGLNKLSGELKGIILIGMKTLIDCLESNLLEKKK